LLIGFLLNNKWRLKLFVKIIQNRILTTDIKISII